MSEKLKPCPFCGKGFRVNCIGAFEHDSEECLLHGLEISRYTQVKKWNTRKPIDDVMEQEAIRFAKRNLSN